MKKSLLALAALTAVAGAAQAAAHAGAAGSSVTMSGIFKAGWASTKYSNGAAGTNGTGRAVGDGSSRIIISGVEDLGGGLFAIFQNDTRFRIDDNGGAPTASPLAGGNTFIGLRGGFGSLRIGKLDTHYCTGSDQHGSRATALTASSCGVLGYVQHGPTNVAIANASRSTNVIRYDLPSVAGLSGGFSYSTAFQSSEAQPPTDKGDAWSANIAYALGTTFRIAASYWNAENEPRSQGQKAWTIAGGFAFGPVDVGLTFDESKVESMPAAALGTSKRRAWSVPVVFNVGAGALLATYTKASDIKRSGAATGNGTVANSGASLISVGYAHNLSKRTSLGVSFARLKNDANANYSLYTQAALIGHGNPSANQDMSQFYFGLRHTF